MSLLPRLAVSYFWLRRLERGGGGSRLSRLDFRKLKTSKTVFVLGTGASINSYPPEWWGIMTANDSISMNFFLIHDHVPTVHVMEDIHGIRAELLAQRYLQRGDYLHVPLVVKTQLSNLSPTRIRQRLAELLDLPQEIRDRAYLSLDLLAAGRTVTEMEASYRRLDKWGLWEPKNRFLMLTKRRGSVSYVINLAVRAGYERIVLCGIDLNHTEYFYDSRRDELAERGIPVPINDETGTVHSTNDPATNPVTIRDVIFAIDRTILRPRGIEIMVGSETSALFPDLPRFDWEAASGEPGQEINPSGQNQRPE